METRQITQVKIWKLILNPMRSRTEEGNIVAFSTEREKLIDWYRNEKSEEPYYSIGDHYFPATGSFPENSNGEYKYYKIFKQGSILEWMNPLSREEQLNEYNHEIIDLYGHGILCEWIDEEMLSEIGSIYRVY
jgi:hypothetical protein